MLAKFKLWLAVRRLRGDLTKAAEGKPMNKWIIAVDVLQVLGLLWGVFDKPAQAWAVQHGPLAIALVGLMAAINRLLPSWIDMFKQQASQPAQAPSPPPAPK